MYLNLRGGLVRFRIEAGDPDLVAIFVGYFEAEDTQILARLALDRTQLLAGKMKVLFSIFFKSCSKWDNFHFYRLVTSPWIFHLWR